MTNGLGFGANGFPTSEPSTSNALKFFAVRKVPYMVRDRWAAPSRWSLREALIGEWQVKGEASVASTAHGGISHNVAGSAESTIGGDASRESDSLSLSRRWLHRQSLSGDRPIPTSR